jgi:FPC/CPF motif-containing protein YcgG
LALNLWHSELWENKFMLFKLCGILLWHLRKLNVEETREYYTSLKKFLSNTTFIYCFILTPIIWFCHMNCYWCLSLSIFSTYIFIKLDTLFFHLLHTSILRSYSMQVIM